MLLSFPEFWFPLLKGRWNPTKVQMFCFCFFCNCWHKPVARSDFVLGLSPSWDSGWDPLQLPAGRSDERGRERFSGRTWHPKYYPYSTSEVADVAELGRASHAEVSGRCALSPGSVPTSSPCALCSQESHHLLHPGAQVPQVGLNLIFHREPCPYVMLQWRACPGSSLHRDVGPARDPSLHAFPLSLVLTASAPAQCSVHLSPGSCSELEGAWDCLAAEASSSALPLAQQSFASVGISRTVSA